MTINPASYEHVKNRYVQLYVDRDDLLSKLREMVQECKEAVDRLTATMIDPSKPADEQDTARWRIERIREERLEYLRNIESLTKAPRRLNDSDLVKERESEFLRICKLPQVVDAFVDSNDAINIIVRASYTFHSRKYDLGDWVITFGEPDSYGGYRIGAYRRLLRPGWKKGKYPDYLLDDGQFCLGDNRIPITEHFQTERFVQAVLLTIYVVNSVNDAEEESLIPQAFYPIAA